MLNASTKSSASTEELLALGTDDGDIEGMLAELDMDLPGTPRLDGEDGAGSTDESMSRALSALPPSAVSNSPQASALIRTGRTLSSSALVRRQLDLGDRSQSVAGLTAFGRTALEEAQRTAALTGASSEGTADSDAEEDEEGPKSAW